MTFSNPTYKVKVNGTLVSFASAKRWQDPHIRAVSIEKAAKAGDNTITLDARPFDVRFTPADQFDRIFAAFVE